MIRLWVVTIFVTISSYNNESNWLYFYQYTQYKKRDSIYRKNFKKCHHWYPIHLLPPFFSVCVIFRSHKILNSCLWHIQTSYCFSVWIAFHSTKTRDYSYTCVCLSGYLTRVPEPWVPFWASPKPKIDPECQECA